jgi:hypothetical protein
MTLKGLKNDYREDEASLKMHIDTVSQGGIFLKER